MSQNKIEYNYPDKNTILSDQEIAHLSNCARMIGCRFNNLALLKQALSHSSYVADKLQSNERMEFLGDAILDMVICNQLYTTHTELREGALTEIKSFAVSGEMLAQIARKHNFQEYLYLGNEFANRSKLPDSILADAVEAVIAALYLDGGYPAAERYILEELKIPLTEGLSGTENYKSVLQELEQSQGHPTPEYFIKTETGPDHKKTFEVTVEIGGKIMGTGIGSNKKEAEQAAAREALKIINSAE